MIANENKPAATEGGANGAQVSLLLIADSLLSAFEGVRDGYGNDRTHEIRAWRKRFNATPLSAVVPLVQPSEEER